MLTYSISTDNTELLAHVINIWVIKGRRTSWSGLWNVGGRRETYEVLVRKSEINRPLGRPRRRWKRLHLNYRKETVGRSVEWTDLAQDVEDWWALVNTDYMKCGKFLDCVSNY